MKMLLKLNLATITLAILFNGLAVTETKAQSVLGEILKRINAHQDSLSSLRSKVTMTKYNIQLRESEFYEGKTIYRRTNRNQISVRIDWTKPAQESLVLINGQYILYRPRLSQAIVGKIDNTKGNAKVFNALSFLNMSKKEIKAHYNIKYDGVEKVKSTPAWHLVFTPKKADIYKSVELWIDGNGMPIQTKVFEQNNDSTTVLLSDFVKNKTINVADFKLTLPKRTAIIKTSISANIIGGDAGKKTLKEIGKGKPLKKLTVRKKRLPAKRDKKRR